MAKPHTTKPFPFLAERIIERFWAYVDIRESSECWPWIGCLDKDGYGRFAIPVEGKQRFARAHRLAYFLAKGEPGELLVCHHCDNRICCNENAFFPWNRG